MRILLCLVLGACSFDGSSINSVDSGVDSNDGGVSNDGAKTLDASMTDVDPVGSWHVTLTFAPNACGESVSNETIIVSAGHTATLDGTLGVGSITCDPSHCAFDETFTFTGGGYSKPSLQLSLTSNGVITGTGSIMTSPPPCSASLTAQGTRS